MSETSEDWLQELADAGISRRVYALAFNAASAAVPHPHFVPLSVRERMVRAALLAAAAEDR